LRPDSRAALGLAFNKDFFCGYSPERINPGDKKHTVTLIKKVTSGSTPETMKKVDEVYKSIITAGTHPVSSIKVAEAAKVIENSQRDINIAFINELALIFERMGSIRSRCSRLRLEMELLPFRPGLVGGIASASILLPYAQGAGDRLSPRGDPRGAAHQRQYGAFRREQSREAHDPQGPQGARRPCARPRHHVQGELHGHSKLASRRYRGLSSRITAARWMSMIPGPRARMWRMSMVSRSSPIRSSCPAPMMRSSSRSLTKSSRTLDVRSLRNKNGVIYDVKSFLDPRSSTEGSTAALQARLRIRINPVTFSHEIY